MRYCPVAVPERLYVMNSYALVYWTSLKENEVRLEEFTFVNS